MGPVCCRLMNGSSGSSRSAVCDLNKGAAKNQAATMDAAANHRFRSNRCTLIVLVNAGPDRALVRVSMRFLSAGSIFSVKSQPRINCAGRKMPLVLEQRERINSTEGINESRNAATLGSVLTPQLGHSPIALLRWTPSGLRLVPHTPAASNA